MRGRPSGWYVKPIEELLQIRRKRLVAISVAGCVLFSYVIPTLIERSLAVRLGPRWAYVVVGDAAGCVAIGVLTRWRIGLGLYIALAAIEAVLLRYRLVGGGALSWIVDAVPTLVLCTLVWFLVKLRSATRMGH